METGHYPKCDICQKFSLTVESGTVRTHHYLCDRCTNRVQGAVEQFMLTITREAVTLKVIEELQKYQMKES